MNATIFVDHIEDLPNVIECTILMETADSMMVFVHNDGSTRVLKRGTYVMNRH